MAVERIGQEVYNHEISVELNTPFSPFREQAIKHDQAYINFVGLDGVVQILRKDLFIRFPHTDSAQRNSLVDFVVDVDTHDQDGVLAFPKLGMQGVRVLSSYVFELSLSDSDVQRREFIDLTFMKASDYVRREIEREKRRREIRQTANQYTGRKRDEVLAEYMKEELQKKPMSPRKLFNRIGVDAVVPLWNILWEKWQVKFDDNDLVINELKGNISSSDFELKGSFENIMGFILKPNEDIIN